MKTELENLSKEIIHLAKLNKIEFEDSNDYEFNTLKSKITDDCEILIKFEV